MRFALLLCVLVAGAMAGYKSRVRREQGGKCESEFANLSEKEFEELFQKLLAQLGEEFNEVTGDVSKVTEDKRRELLKKAIEDHEHVEGDDHKSYSLNINKFSIMTAAEKSQRTGLNISEDARRKFQMVQEHNRLNAHKYYKRAVPASVNHCAATGPVEDQASCGSCWAFAASHALGGRLRLRDGGDTVYRLSEQQATDCAYDRSGCGGGHTPDGWESFALNKMATDFKYPYNGIFNGNSKCNDNSGRMDGFLKRNEKVTYAYYADAPPAKDINAIKQAVAEGPVTLYMFVGDAKNDYQFSQTGNGVYDPPAACASHVTNHAMVICGYGNDATTGKDYWMVKNSWGTSFGDNGYIKVVMGKNACGIEGEVFFPLLDSAKKTDTSSVCVNAKSCSSDSDCNNISNACVSGACKCDVCVSNAICQTDADCGGKQDSCVSGGDGRRHPFVRQVSDNRKRCSCSNECKTGKSCSSDASCGGEKGACKPNGLSSACKCGEGAKCIAAQQCTSDIHCGGVSKACQLAGYFQNAERTPWMKCECDINECKTGRSCSSDASCGGEKGACKPNGSTTSACKCGEGAKCIADQQCTSDIHCGGLSKSCQLAGYFQDTARTPYLKCQCDTTCVDTRVGTGCEYFSRAGSTDCQDYPGQMFRECRKSCNLCIGQ